MALKAATPGAANDLLKKIRALINQRLTAFSPNTATVASPKCNAMM
jgi:hypothetical protein